MTTFTVSSSAELQKTLNAAQGGDTILLINAGEKYTLVTGQYSASKQVNYSSMVTITSADQNDPAVFDSATFRQGTNNITLDHVVFDSTVNGLPTSGTDLVIYGDNITVSNSTFINGASGVPGVDDDAVKGGNAIQIRGADGINIVNNKISNYFMGIGMLNADNVVLKGNEITQIQGDSIRGGGWRDVLIEGNYIHDVLGSSQSVNHSDMIQMWSSNTNYPSENVTIRGNILDSGNGSGTQSIFMRNEVVDTGTKDASFFYKNIVIEDNIIRNGHLHGITVGETDGLIIQNNTLVTNMETPMGGSTGISSPSIRTSNNSINVTVTDNIAGGYNLPSNSITDNNIRVNYNAPLNPYYYQNVFINAAGGKLDLAGLLIKPGSAADISGAGAQASTFSSTPDHLTAAYTTQKYLGQENIMLFDASLTASKNGYLGDKATYTWDFGDGTSATGRVVTHSFSTGLQTVTLTVTAGGETDTFVSQPKIRDSNLLDIDFENGDVSDNSSYDAVITSKNVDAIVNGGTDHEKAYSLSGNNLIVLGRSESQFFNLDQMKIFMDIQRSSVTSGDGSLLSIHKNFSFGINAAGALTFSLYDAAGQQITLTSTSKITDTNWHNVGVVYDTIAKTVDLVVDGAVVGTGTSGTFVKPAESWSLVVGQMWGKTFTGLIDNLTVSSDVNTHPVTLPESQQPPVQNSDDGASANTGGENSGNDGTSNGGETSLSILTPTYNSSDAMIGNEKDNNMYGGHGSHHGKTVAVGLDGNDYIRAFDLAIGGEGNDKLYADTTSGSKLYGGEGDDILVGYGGNDLLVGGNGSDNMRGGSGDDVIVFDHHDNFIQGSSGFDTALYSESGDLDFGAGAFVQGIEKLDLTNGQENTLIIGYQDVIQADNDVLVIAGDAGKDNIVLHSGFAATGDVVVKDGLNYVEYVMTGSRGTAHALVDENLHMTTTTT